MSEYRKKWAGVPTAHLREQILIQRKMVTAAIRNTGREVAAAEREQRREDHAVIREGMRGLVDELIEMERELASQEVRA